MFVPLVPSTEFSWLGEGLWSESPSHLERARILAPIPENKLHFTCRLIWFHVLRATSARLNPGLPAWSQNFWLVSAWLRVPWREAQ